MLMYIQRCCSTALNVCIRSTTKSANLFFNRRLLCLPRTAKELYNPCSKQISLIAEVDQTSIQAFGLMSKLFPRAWGFLWGLEENSLSDKLLKLSEDHREAVYKKLADRRCTELDIVSDTREAFCVQPGLITVGGEKGKQIISEAYKCVGVPPFVSFKNDLAFVDLKNKVPLSFMVRDAPASFNIHPAPPEKRGAGVYVPSLIAGETHYGCTLHYMTPGVDDGSIIAVERFEIPQGSTKTSLRKLTTDVSLEMLEDLLLRIKFTEPITSIATKCHYKWRGEQITRKMARRMVRETETKFGEKGHPALL